MADNNNLDEILFEHRNKEYGAYDLRNVYPKMLTKAFLLGTFLFALAAFTPLIYLTIKNLNKSAKPDTNRELVNIIQEDKIFEKPEDTPPPPPPPKVEPPKQEVIQNVVPEPKKAPKIETPPPPITKQLETTTGLQNQDGVKTPTYAPPPPPPSTGKGNTVEVKPQVNENQIYSEVEQLAEFPGGGINAFRKKVETSFDTSAMDGDEGTVKTEITFVVEKDGSITDVKASGSNKNFNEEAMRTVRSIKNKWSPAKINGTAVRYRFRLPISMNFE